MTLEESLAARRIMEALEDGYCKEVAIQQAARPLVSQRYSHAHSVAVEQKMAGLV